MELITQKMLLSTLARANLVGAFYSNDPDIHLAFHVKNMEKYIILYFASSSTTMSVSGGSNTIHLGQGINILSAYGSEITASGKKLMDNDGQDQTITLTIPRWTNCVIYKLEI